MPHPKTWQFAIKDIAEAANLPLRNVYFHIDSGNLVPADLRSVAMFVSYHYYRKLREDSGGGRPLLSSYRMPSEGDSPPLNQP